MLEKTDRAIKNGQTRDTEIIGHKTKQTNRKPQHRKLKRSAIWSLSINWG